MVPGQPVLPLRHPKFNIRVLVAPLDWGLGHSTRCIPIIHSLQAKGCTVIIATEGTQEKLLRQEFSNNDVNAGAMEFIPLQGYRIKYAKRFLMLRLSSQLLHIRKMIHREHEWLEKIIEEQKIDWVISDNRYGLWTKRIPCTFITHQLRVKLPSFLSARESFVQRRLYQFINRYNACWVPDLPDADRGLSGDLGHPTKKPETAVRYLGWLSRFVNTDEPVSGYRYKCLVVLTGPEPMRSLLEKELLPQLQASKEQIMLVRGLPASETALPLPPNIEVHPHLPATALQAAFLHSEFIVSRSGYSTLMDAFTLQKKCIFIPTPGQTEQEYLGERLRSRKMALVYRQQNFDLQNALEAAEQYSFHFPLNSMNDLLEMTVDSFLKLHFKPATHS